MTEISDKCEVPCSNNRDSPTADPLMQTIVLKTSLGKVVAQTTNYRRGRPNTNYGVLVEELPWAESGLGKQVSDPEDYSKPFSPASDNPSVVYVVQKATTEEQKRELAKVLRTECQKYDAINFF